MDSPWVFLFHTTLDFYFETLRLNWERLSAIKYERQSLFTVRYYIEMSGLFRAFTNHEEWEFNLNPNAVSKVQSTTTVTLFFVANCPWHDLSSSVSHYVNALKDIGCDGASKFVATTNEIEQRNCVAVKLSTESCANDIQRGGVCCGCCDKKPSLGSNDETLPGTVSAPLDWVAFSNY